MALLCGRDGRLRPETVGLGPGGQWSFDAGRHLNRTTTTAIRRDDIFRDFFVKVRPIFSSAVAAACCTKGALVAELTRATPVACLSSLASSSSSTPSPSGPRPRPAPSSEVAAAAAIVSPKKQNPRCFLDLFFQDRSFFFFFLNP
jgi:hypothetical protein